MAFDPDEMQSDLEAVHAEHAVHDTRQQRHDVRVIIAVRQLETTWQLMSAPGFAAATTLMPVGRSGLLIAGFGAIRLTAAGRLVDP
jgi:hypothetical protein